MVAARRTFVVFAWAFLVAVVVQFFLAGLGVLGGESIEAHRQWGFVVLHLLPILMMMAAVAGRMGRVVIGASFGLVILVFLQPLFAAPDLDPPWLRSFHVLNALLIVALGYYLARRGSEATRITGVAG